MFALASSRGEIGQSDTRFAYRGPGVVLSWKRIRGPRPASPIRLSFPSHGNGERPTGRSRLFVPRHGNNAPDLPSHGRNGPIHPGEALPVAAPQEPDRTSCAIGTPLPPTPVHGTFPPHGDRVRVPHEIRQFVPSHGNNRRDFPCHGTNQPRHGPCRRPFPPHDNEAQVPARTVSNCRAMAQRHPTRPGSARPMLLLVAHLRGALPVAGPRSSLDPRQRLVPAGLE